MQRVLLLVACAATLLVLAKSIHEPVEAGQATVAGNGDVNGDGARDIGDAIYLLSWLFQGGPEPIALAGSPDLEERLSDLADLVARLHEGETTIQDLAVRRVHEVENEFVVSERWGWEPWKLPAVAYSEAARDALLDVEIDGRSPDAVLALRRSEAINEVGRLDVVVAFTEPNDTPAALLGRDLRVKYSANPAREMRGEIANVSLTALSSEQAVYHITAYDRSHRMTRGRRSRSFIDAKDSDIMEQIGGEAGLLVELSFDNSLANVVHEYVLQHNQTDLDFLRSLARDPGYWWIQIDEEDESIIRFGDGPSGRIPRDTRTGTIRYAGHGPLRAGAVGVSSLQVGTQSSLARVTVRGWDPVRKRAIVGTASQPAGSGADVEFGVFGSDAGTLESIAQARLEALQAAARNFSGTSTAPQLRPGQIFRIEGPGSSVDGDVFITRVQHQFVMVDTPSGQKLVYGNRFEGQPASAPSRPPQLDLAKSAGKSEGIQSTAIGIVTTAPDGLGRVKVRFPWLGSDDGEVSSGWLRVAQNHDSASGRKFIPEIDDEVLIAFEHGDLRRPMIIGRLWNSIDRPPSDR